MAGEISILAAVAKLAEMTIAVKLEEHHAMTRACKLVQREAKAEIGHYQERAGQFGAWAPLAESTLAEKERLGYAPPDNPLLREGHLRDSIEISVSAAGAASTEGVIGSNSDIAVYQELGTSRIPPRSFLGSAAVHTAPKVAEVLGAGVVSALIGRQVAGGSLPIMGTAESG